MRVRLAAQAVALLCIVGFVLAVDAGAQSASAPPSSLRVTLGDLFITSGTTLQNGTAPAAGACAPSLGPNGGTPSKTWTFAMPFAGGMAGGNQSAPGGLLAARSADDQGGAEPSGTGMWHLRDTVTFTMALGANPPAPAALTGPTGFTAVAVLEGSTKITAPTQTVPAGAQPPASLSFEFKPNETAPMEGHGVPLKLTVTLNGPGASVSAQCGPTSKLGNVIVYRGMPGAGDIDGDGIPDAEDSDRDGDGVPNTAEPGTCAFFTPPHAYADDGTIAPGKDSDGDGVNDDVECSARPASDPTSRLSVPAKPKTILQLLMPWILLLVILLILAAIVWVFLRYGKTAKVTIVSQPELFIPPGTKGKYEVAVQNLSKKGEARTYQLVVSGQPEGWDAKLNVDHVTLEPEGGATNRQVVWMEVEAPTHAEPESAVVTVKAVPLNKAGRKDTFKLPGKAETITSINVPPGSKVPVKRGGKVVAAEAPEAGEPSAGDAPLTLVALGADEASAKKLGAAGVADSEQLRRGDAAALSKKTKIPEPTLKTWQQVADLVRLGMTPQQAAALATAGIGSIPQLADADGKDVAAKASVDEKTGKGWVKAANKYRKKHADEMPATPAAAAPPSPSTPASVPPAVAAPAAPPAKPALQVGGLRHEPPAFRQGEAVKSFVNVANNGKEPNTIKLSLYVNDGLADVQTVTVKGGKTKDVQFKWTAQEKNKLNIRGEIVPS